MNASEWEAVKQRLNELHKKSGRITPDIVLQDAEDETSPLHGYFEWDDSVAGHAYRIDQARTLRRCAMPPEC